MSTLRVLVVAEQLRRTVPGGIGRAARELLLALNHLEGVQVALWASRPPRPANRPGQRDPLAELGWPVRSSQLPGPLLTRAWDRGLMAAPRGFDVVHAVSLAAPPVRTGGPGASRATVTAHDLAWRHIPDVTTARGRRWHEAALRRALRRSAHLIVPSLRVAQDLEEAGAPTGAVSVVPWGADHLGPADEPATEELLGRLGVRGPFLLTVGTLEPRKNLAALIAGYRRIRTSLPEPWPLVVVGPRGWGAVEQSLRPAAGQGVVLAGPVSDAVLVGLYRRARLLAYVPLEEGFGLPPLEALSVGLPVVASQDVPSVGPGAWADPVAVLADPRDIDSIAQALVSGSTDEALRARLVASGAQLARARTWRASAQSYLARWRELA